MSATTRPDAEFVPVPFVSDSDRDAALECMASSYKLPHGLTVLSGPPGSGLSALVAEHLATLPKRHDADVPTVHIDVRGATVGGILVTMLEAFGYPLRDAKETESLALTHVVAQHHAEHGTPPVVAFDHVDEARPPILQLIADLAAMRQRRQSTYRIVLAGGESVNRIIEAEAMELARVRMSCQATIGAMDEDRARSLIRALLNANDLEADDASVDVLWHGGRGLPGRITRLVADSMGAHAPRPDAMISAAGSEFDDPADATEIRRIPADAGTSLAFDDGGTETLGDDQAPLGEILVNCDGELLERYVIHRRKVLIGRAPHNDIVLPSRWVSRHHAIIICTPDAATLIDVNSTNGMTVNSRQVRQQGLAHNDIVVIGDYRLKYRNVRVRQREDAESLSDTRVLRSLASDTFAADEKGDTKADKRAGERRKKRRKRR